MAPREAEMEKVRKPPPPFGDGSSRFADLHPCRVSGEERNAVRGSGGGSCCGEEGWQVGGDRGHAQPHMTYHMTHHMTHQVPAERLKGNRRGCGAS